MSPKPRLFRVRRRDGIVQIDLLAPEMIGDDTIDRMAEQVAAIIDAEKVPRIVMNFEDVRHISSMMLGTLISLFIRIKARGGQLRLAALREKHRRLLAVVKLDGVFEVHPTPEQAAASFK